MYFKYVLMQGDLESFWKEPLNKIYYYYYLIQHFTSISWKLKTK